MDDVKWIKAHTSPLELVNGENVRVLSSNPTDTDILLALATRIIRELNFAGYKNIMIDDFINKQDAYERQYMKDNGFPDG